MKRASLITRAVLTLFALAGILYFSLIRSKYQEFCRGLTVVSDLRLTDRRPDVRYRLGDPPQVLGPVMGPPYPGSREVFTVDGPPNDVNTMPSKTSILDYSAWEYDNSHGDKIIDFDKTGVVDSITVYAKDAAPSAWGPIGGIRNGDSEEKVLNLGVPSTTSIDGVTKTIEFADIGLQFWLEKGRVYRVQLKHPTKGERARFWRFLHTLMP